MVQQVSCCYQSIPAAGCGQGCEGRTSKYHLTSQNLRSPAGSHWLLYFLGTQRWWWGGIITAPGITLTRYQDHTGSHHHHHHRLYRADIVTGLSGLPNSCHLQKSVLGSIEINRQNSAMIKMIYLLHERWNLCNKLIGLLCSFQLLFCWTIS